MSQTNTKTNTNTNTGAGNTNQSHNTRRGGRGQGGSSRRGRAGRGNNCGKNTVTRYSFEGKMKDGPLSKLTITEGGQQATQYKKIIDVLPVFCADKGYKFIDDVIQTNTKLLEAAFLPTYPEATQWSSTYHVQIDVVNTTVATDPLTGLCPLITEMQRKSHVFNPNL